MIVSIQQAQNALIDLLGTFVDPNDSNSVITVGDSQVSCGVGETYPAIWVRRGRLVRREEIAADLYRDTRQFQVLAYIGELCNNDDDEITYDNASNWIQPLHQFLATNRNQLEAAGVIVDITAVTDTGDVTVGDRKGNKYAGVAFTVPVQMYTRF